MSPQRTGDNALHIHPATPLLPALADSLVGTPWQGARLAPLPDSGLAHHHVAIIGSEPPALSRIPKQSQLRLDATTNLEYQAACFDRAEPSGHTPRLFATLQPSQGLSRGALIVEHVSGRGAVLAAPDARKPVGAADPHRADPHRADPHRADPHRADLDADDFAPDDVRHADHDDLAAIVRALASIHSLSVPDVREPLMSPSDPLADLAAEIDVQAEFLGSASLQPHARALIDRELTRLDTLVRGDCRPSVSLVSFDAHPGNFLIRDDGEAVLVDLEKCRYSYPSLDLAHATLYTSTSWERGAAAWLTPAQVREVHELWESTMDRAGSGRAGAGRAGSGRAGSRRRGAGRVDDSEWHVPLRRAMWLWSVTWCAKWRVLSGAAPSASGDGEDWAAANSADQLSRHVRGRVDHYLSADIIERVTREFDEL